MLTAIEAFFKNHVFIHTHIEKCGGSTLSHHMTALFGEYHVLDLRAYPPIHALKILAQHPNIRKKIPKIKVLSGHFWYNNYWHKLFMRADWMSCFIFTNFLPFFRKKPLYIASVRHPIDRLVSLYRYTRTRPEHKLHDPHIKNFDEFIRKLVDTRSFRMNNEMCHLFSGKRHKLNAFEVAKHSFEHQYFAVVPYDKTHQLANIIAETFGLPLVKDVIINPSETTEKIQMSEETLALLQEKCQEDIKLYEYILKHYPEKLQYAKQRLQHLMTK